MKALFLIPLFFSTFFIFIGISTRKSARDPLSSALIVGGVILAVAVITIWIIMFIKEKREKEAKTETKTGLGDSDS